MQGRLSLAKLTDRFDEHSSLTLRDTGSSSSATTIGGGVGAKRSSGHALRLSVKLRATSKAGSLEITFIALHCALRWHLNPLLPLPP